MKQKTNKELFSLYDSELVFHYRTPKPLKETRRILQHFYDYLGEYPPSTQLAKSYLSQFADRKPRTLEKYVTILRAFFKWYGEELDIKIKTGRQLPTYVESADVDKLVDAMRSENKKTHKKLAQRDILLVNLAIHTGLRRSEIANLKVGDIDVERSLLNVKAGKGNKDRTVPLAHSIALQLSEWIKGKPQDENVFSYVAPNGEIRPLSASRISGMIKIFADKAGVKLHAHALRDHFATSLMEKGVNLREIQELLGHSSLAVTERYTLLKPEHLADAVEKLDKPEKPIPATIKKTPFFYVDPTQPPFHMSWQEPIGLPPGHPLLRGGTQ